MKKIMCLLILFFVTFSCFATKVGEKIYYLNAPLGYRNTDSFLTKVEPISGREGYYSVELTTIITPAGNNSAVGLFTFKTHYTVKEKDKITLYQADYFSSKPTTLVVSKISNNEIEFSTAASVLNEE